VLIEPLPIRRISESAATPADRTVWPATLPPVRHLLDHGLEPGRLTILVGENGAGKSTIVEAIAMAYGLSREGGSTGARHATRDTESELHSALRIERGIGASKWGYFIRAETLHGLFSYLEDNPNPGGADLQYHRMSHGESFMGLVATRPFYSGGLFVLDEPEAALSFETQLSLVGHLADLARDEMSQVIVATHSPIVAATPGAALLQLDDDGLTPTTWERLTLVDHYRRFLDGPARYLRHVVD
jgi:predicted ATPase